MVASGVASGAAPRRASMRSGLALALALLGAACSPAQREPAAQATAVGQPEQPAPAVQQSPAPAQQAPEELRAAGDDSDAAVVAAIEQAVNQTRAARHDCWARAAADDYHLSGRVTLRVRFEGHSLHPPFHGPPVVTIVDDEPGDPVLTSCLVAVYQAHAWPAVPTFAVPGTVIELPFAFEAPAQQYTVRAEDVAPLPLPGPLQVRALLHENNTGNPGVGLVLATLDPMPDARTAHWEAPADGRTTRLFYVLEGAVELATEPKGKAVRVAAGQAVVVPPDMPHALRFAPDARLSMVQIAVPAGAALWPVVEGDPPDAPAARRNRRKARLPAVQTRPRVFPIAGGQAEIAIFYDRAGGLEAASLGVITAKPGMRIPAHVHEHETEMVLILEGAGTMTVGGETHRIAPMTAIQIPPGVEHSVVFDSDGPVRALQVYTPSGPEQRFKQPPTP
jgi:quercetin dioxygenase-like cupin family protein